nr:hypothetical protein GCM10020092_093770 [Actinoplanes digitatis]
MPGHELARLPELSSEQAHRIVMDRLNRGPYHRPDELIARGVLPARTVARLAGRLICLPPTPLDTPSGWHSPHSTPHG